MTAVKGVNRPSFYIALLAVIVAAVVVALGAFTRLSHAGLGCPDWPTCYGHLWVPSSEADIQLANQSFVDTPVETDKTWPEQTHRIFASSLGVLTIVLAGFALRYGRLLGQPKRLPLFLVALIVLQGLFGMWTVTLKLWPQVVTAHLLGGFTTLALLWLLVLRLSGSRWRVSPQQINAINKLRSLCVVALLVVIIQIALGAWTSANYAALACPDLPMCQNEWLPSNMDIKDGFNLFQHVGPNYLGGQLHSHARVAIHFFHRIGAVLTACTLLLLVVVLLKTKEAHAQRMAFLITGVLFLQIGLGLSNVFFTLPLPVAVAHNCVGALLLLCLVTLNQRVWTVCLALQAAKVYPASLRRREPQFNEADVVC